MRCTIPRRSLLTRSTIATLTVLCSTLHLPALAQTSSDETNSSTEPSHEFIINDGSTRYSAKLYVSHCDAEECQGEGRIQLFDKANQRFVHTCRSDDLNCFLTAEQKPTVNVIQLYDEQSPLIFNDFNFDGSEDLAIRNGNQGSYSGPSYDVYVFNQSRGQFVLSEELTALAYENLGMFQTDPVRKRLTVFAKSGCCWHQTTEYAVVPKRGLVATKILTEDAARPDGRYVYVTTETRKNGVNGKMVSKTKKYKTEN